jgi:DEAD/DEAH box helicase domain-containing protein
MERIVYFDLETKYSADEVGGWNHIEDMGMSVGVVWDSHDERFHVYLDHQVLDLEEHCRRADLVVGFNHVSFDYHVLAGARFADQQQRSQLHTDLAGLNNFDMLVELKKQFCRRTPSPRMVQAGRDRQDHRVLQDGCPSDTGPLPPRA